MDVLHINNAHIAYRHRPGLGRTIVFANSLGSDQSLWDEVISALPGGYGILSCDLRGHGLSNGCAENIESLAEDVSLLIDALALKDVLFCGVSIGGMIGQVLAAKRPDVIHGAVLCNTASRIGSAERWNDRIATIEDSGIASLAATIVGNWFGPEYSERRDRLCLHQTMVERTTNAGYVAACKAIREADLRDYAASITIPVLCIAGTHDKSVPLDDVKELAASIPQATVQIMDGLGHLPCLEAPLELAGLIESFDVSIPTMVDTGMNMRCAVLGSSHVKRANTNITELDKAFQQLISNGAWGTVWASVGISVRERSMLTLALLAATGNFEEIPMHVRATARTGATIRDISEAFQHVAIYAGLPRANHALKLAKQTLAEMDAPT